MFNAECFAGNILTDILHMKQVYLKKKKCFSFVVKVERVKNFNNKQIMERSF